MEQYKLQTPPGVGDTLPDERYHKRRLQARLLELFSQNGFSEIETPAMEYYEVFSGASHIPQEQMTKLLDSDGRILVLRPDLTMPIARIAATKLSAAPQPIRLCYAQDTFVNNALDTDRVSPQVGVELLGETSAYADAEIIALSIRSLKSCGLESFQIELGQVSFFKGLMEETGLSSQDIERLRGLIEEKNILDIELFLSKLEVHRSVLERIMYLPELYGGGEVLDEAEKTTTNSRCRMAVDNIRKVYKLLCDYGYEKYVSIDLGMVHAIYYYSGIIFKGMTAHAGQPILSGGRYDGLVGEYGCKMPATGFALSLKPVLVAVERQGALLRAPAADIIIGFAQGYHREAYAEAEKLRESGLRVEMFYSQSGLLAAAEKRGVRQAFYYDGILREVIP